MDFKTRKHTDNGKCYGKQSFVLLLLTQKGEDRERRIRLIASIIKFDMKRIKKKFD
jgi:ribosomal protein L35